MPSPLKYVEGYNESIVVDMQERLLPLAYPYPSDVRWYVDFEAVRNDSGRTFSYPIVTFTSMRRFYDGHYILRATNHRLDGRSEVGTAKGEFILNVLCTLCSLHLSHQ